MVLEGGCHAESWIRETALTKLHVYVFAICVYMWLYLLKWPHICVLPLFLPPRESSVQIAWSAHQAASELMRKCWTVVIILNGMGASDIADVRIHSDGTGLSLNTSSHFPDNSPLSVLCLYCLLHSLSLSGPMSGTILNCWSAAFHYYFTHIHFHTSSLCLKSEPLYLQEINAPLLFLSSFECAVCCTFKHQ